jgi:hypothetical protein
VQFRRRAGAKLIEKFWCVPIYRELSIL